MPAERMTFKQYAVIDAPLRGLADLRRDCLSAFRFVSAPVEGESREVEYLPERDIIRFRVIERDAGKFLLCERNEFEAVRAEQEAMSRLAYYAFLSRSGGSIAHMQRDSAFRCPMFHSDGMFMVIPRNDIFIKMSITRNIESQTY
jgi:hypothetical protein